MKIKDRPLMAGARCYLCIGPNCWGKGFTEEQAVKAAKSNFSRSIGGPWKLLMFDAPADAMVGGMGTIDWTPSYHAEEFRRSAVELYRSGVAEEHKRGQAWRPTSNP